MYFKCLKDGDCTYSIDRFTFDFYFLPESGLYDLLKTSLDLLALEYRQQMNVQDFVTKRLGFEKLVYQFDHLHIELWKRENTVTITRYIPEDDKYLKAYVAGEKQCVLRLDFNPNKCEDNKPLERLMHFFAITEKPVVFSISRIDYALDVPEPIKNFYVLSRKMEGLFGTTRYYGSRSLTGHLRVYDKRKEQIDKEKHDIGHDLTRFEWVQKGNRDFNFTFDTITRLHFDGVYSTAALIQFVEPALINHALNTLNYRTRKKLKEEVFEPLEVRKELFEKLLQMYFDLYKLPMEYRRDYEKQFAPENLGLTFCEEYVI